MLTLWRETRKRMDTKGSVGGAVSRERDIRILDQPDDSAVDRR